MVKDKKAIKKDILDKFREIEAEQDILLPDRWLSEEYFGSLSIFEQKMFKKAIKELISKGLVKDINKPSLNLKLTAKGADLIH